jgi:PKD repeat protein
MKKPRWHAKAFSIIVALAFALSLVPLTATPVAAEVHADFWSYPRDFAKVGQQVCFFDWSGDGSTPVRWEWDFDGDGTWDLNGVYPAPCHTYMDPGTYTVIMRATWPSGATDTETKTAYITVEWGLITEPWHFSYDGYSYSAPSGIRSQIGYNVLKDEAIFVVPDAFKGKVINWVLSGDGIEVAGGNGDIGLPYMPPDPDGIGPFKFDWIQVQSVGITVGEVLITAQIDLGEPPPTADLSLYATKKWGDINFTELDIMTPIYEWCYDYGYYELVDWEFSDCPGESEVVWYEGCYKLELPEWLGGGYIERCKTQFGYGYLREGHRYLRDQGPAARRAVMV